MTLYIVATPIGNLEDITLRALEVLKKVDLIACEDTRVTSRLLEKYSICKETISYHKFSDSKKTNELVELLKSGKDIALVSDAGTPLICDPGCWLIEEARKENVNVVPIPGSSALTTFLSALPKIRADFYFGGFLPRKDGELKTFFENCANNDTFFYDSPNRLIKSLEILKAVRPKARVAIGRELTKIYEEIIVDEIENVIEYYNSHTLKGEIIGLVFCEQKPQVDMGEILNKANILIKDGYSKKDAARILSLLFGVSKNKINDFLIK